MHDTGPAAHYNPSNRQLANFFLCHYFFCNTFGIHFHSMHLPINWFLWGWCFYTFVICHGHCLPPRMFESTESQQRNDIYTRSETCRNGWVDFAKFIPENFWDHGQYATITTRRTPGDPSFETFVYQGASWRILSWTITSSPCHWLSMSRLGAAGKAE